MWFERAGAVITRPPCPQCNNPMVYGRIDGYQVLVCLCGVAIYLRGYQQ